MNNKILLYLLIAFFPIKEGIAQAEENNNSSLNNEFERKHVLKTNILSLLTTSASLSYEHTFINLTSLQAGIYYGRSTLLDGIERLSITAEYRMYLSKEKSLLVGTYLAPYLKYQHIVDREEDKNEKTTAVARISTIGVGLLLGRQWIARKGFTVDMYAGAGFNPQVKLKSLSQLDKNHPYYFSERRWQADIRLGMVIGYAF
ncbi:DUF3575 domain-containing protein [Rhodocytophaga aerolata]|uniref:DUF3575 domain-containing protein n=1 Tax=Rhodocytophaga aerolata TaxID=455078 RepID=A0ABT8R408_9BACT|nr:DUF3575 domain-containing protein [Rhodocytophaga aerolata]MDO1446841.1 DUF3575 domain-containing protein [Rhodocytophaga aerolata]